MLECRVCAARNPDDARFCNACGTPLWHEARGTDERKVVTVLFADIVGSTTRADGADPEDVRAELSLFHETVRGEIERYGGTVEKYIGDAVAAVFGAPAVHEDDAARAVLAALRIVEAVDGLAVARPGSLSVRIGIETGVALVAVEADVRSGEGIVAGDVVNVAARLQGVADPGSIVVGEATHRRTGDTFDFEALGEVELKGKRRPARVWRVIGTRGRFGSDVSQTSSTPFLGRDFEMAALRGAFDRAVTESSRQFLTLSAEPGGGKSRLLWEFHRQLDDDPGVLATWRQGRCLPYGGGAPHRAVSEIVKGLVGILESDDAATATGKVRDDVARAIDDPDEAAWVAARLAELVASQDVVDPSSASAAPEESYAAWAAYLEATATRDPLVLVLEDVHWAGEALVDFIDHFVRRSEAVPIMLICTARPELFDRHPGWGGGVRNSINLALPALSAVDTERLVDAVLRQARLPDDARSALLERSGGNPLFAEEYVRMLADRGLLDGDGSGGTAGHQELPMPESIESSIAARLDALPRARKSLLQDASVVGKVFWSGALVAMGGGETEDVQEALAELARRELIRTSRTSVMAGQREYSFWHALVRDVAYEQIPRPARVDKHVAAADWVGTEAGDLGGDAADLVAHHRDQAFTIAGSAGLEATRVEALRVAAAEAQAAAGDRAARLDQRSAAAYYRRALELIAEDAPARGSILVKLAAATSEGMGGTGEGRLSETEHILDQAIDAFRAAGDDDLGLGAAITERANQLRFQGRSAEASELLDEALRILEPMGPTRELASAIFLRAGWELLTGRELDFRAWADRAISMVELVDAPDLRSRALQFQGWIAEFDAAPEAALSSFGDALEVAKETGSLRAMTSAYTNYADVYHECVSPAAGSARYEEAVGFLRSRGVAAMWPYAEWTRTLYALGRWGDVERVCSEILAWDRERGTSQLTGLALPQLARVLTLRGRAQEAFEAVSEYLPTARHDAYTQILPLVAIAGAMAAVALDRREEAVALMESVPDFREGWERRTTPCQWAVPDGVRVLIEAGAPDSARRMMSGRGGAIPLLVVQDRTCAALLDEAAGDREAARAGYQEVRQEWSHWGCPYELAMAELGIGRTSMALGRPEDARAAADRARPIFSALGAVGRLTEADALLNAA